MGQNLWSLIMEEKIDSFLQSYFGQIYMRDVRDMLLIKDSQKSEIGLVEMIYKDAQDVNGDLGCKITLLFLEFIMLIEETFNIEISDFEIDDIKTFTQLKQTILDKIEAKK